LQKPDLASSRERLLTVPLARSLSFSAAKILLGKKSKKGKKRAKREREGELEEAAVNLGTKDADGELGDGSHRLSPFWGWGKKSQQGE